MTRSKQSTTIATTKSSKSWQGFLCFMAVSDIVFEGKQSNSEQLFQSAIGELNKLIPKFLGKVGYPFDWITEETFSGVTEAQLKQQTASKPITGKQVFEKVSVIFIKLKYLG